MLSERQVAQFRRDGYLVAEGAVTDDQLAAMRAEITGWVEASRSHSEPFGEPTIDGRPRFDMGAEHSAARPALRRVNNPSDVSAAFRQVMENAAMVDMVADLVGPDVKFHHCKINLKLPGSNTEVGYHQDFAYTPHSNDDVITALLMLDDMSLDNGCLQVVPGSHLGPVHSLFDGERFIGTMAADVVAELKPKEVPVTGAAGTVCLMHWPMAPTPTARIARARSTSAFTVPRTRFRWPRTPCPAPMKDASCAAGRAGAHASWRGWSSCPISPDRPRSSPSRASVRPAADQLRRRRGVGSRGP